MKITLNKTIQPQIASLLSGIKDMELYKFDGYSQTESILEAPSKDLTLSIAINIARIGAIIEGYEYWVEIPDININDNLPAGLSYEKYFDDQDPPVEQIRTWDDLGLNAQGVSNSIRFWQPANNGEFLYKDVELIEDAGFTVFGKQLLILMLNDSEYSDTGNPEYSILETIEWIDENWRFGGYFDIIEAWLTMQEIYEAKGTTDALRWDASTINEKRVLGRWNQVGLNRVGDIVPGSWSEAKTLKELSRQYREFNTNIVIALIKRFDDWYQYINLILSNTGRTKFDSDWDWMLRSEYINRHLHFYELNTMNKLLEWHDTVFSTYVNADFITSTLTANNIVSGLRNVLVGKKYYL